MKFLKGLIIALLIIIIAILVVAFFLPSKRHIEESIYIKSPAKHIYEQVVIMKNWKKWSPFSETDTAMKTYYDGPPQGVGAIMKWESKKQGDGIMTILETEKDKNIKLKLEFEGQGVSHSEWIFTEEKDSTKVAWNMDIENLTYPLGRILGIFMPGAIHKAFHKGLENLKKISEEYCAALKKFSTSEINIKQEDKKHALVVKDSSKCSEVIMAIGKIFGTVMQYIGANKIECTSPPFVRYLFWDEKADKCTMESGVFVKGPVASSGNIKYVEIPAQKVVSAIHTGAYESISNTHAALNNFIKEKKLIISGAPYEIYITDPEKEPDITKWQTEVCYPVK